MNRKFLLPSAVLAVLACAAVSWAFPRPLGDLYLALAGGRDVLQGKLGQPDDWSYVASGRTWINQSWGSDAVFYLVQRAGGDAGLLALKALLLAGIAALVTVAARIRGAHPAAGLVAAGAALAASPAGMILRPNLVSLLLVPLLFAVLYRSVERPRWIWGAAALVAFWANLHGAYLAGLGLLGLWAVTHLGTWILAPRRARVSPWAPLGAAAVALAAAAFLNPFGPRNLTLPLEMGRGTVWREVTEWQPVWGEGFPTPWLFLVLSGTVVLGGALSGFPGRRREAGGGGAGVVPFETLVVLLTLAFAFEVRRFIPLAAVVLAPILALVLTRVLRPRRTAIPLAVLALVLAGFVLVSHRWLPGFYDPENPRRPRETFLGRMVFHRTDFPAGAAGFLAANEVSGRIFHKYEWEGYLRWRCPSLRLYVGGRAQQIYTGEEFLSRREILLDRNPAARLRSLDVHLAVIKLDMDHAMFAQRLLLESGGSWSYVYCDLRTAVLADVVDADSRRLVERAEDGDLDYPDPAIAALSRGMCLATPAVDAPPRQVMELLEISHRLMPVDYAYTVWDSRARQAGLGVDERVAYLEGELSRLLDLPGDVADAIELYKARENLAKMISNLHPDREKRREAVRLRRADSDRVDALREPY